MTTSKCALLKVLAQYRKPSGLTPSHLTSSLESSSLKTRGWTAGSSASWCPWGCAMWGLLRRKCCVGYVYRGCEVHRVQGSALAVSCRLCVSPLPRSPQRSAHPCPAGGGDPKRSPQCASACFCPGLPTAPSPTQVRPVPAGPAKMSMQGALLPRHAGGRRHAPPRLLPPTPQGAPAQRLVHRRQPGDRGRGCACREGRGGRPKAPEAPKAFPPWRLFGAPRL